MNTSANCYVMTDMGWLLVYLDSWHLRWIRSYILQVYLTNVCHIFHYYLEHWHAELHSDAWACGYEICPHSFNLDLLCTTYFYSFECQYCFEKQLWQLIYRVICLQNPVRFVILQYFLRLICIWFFAFPISVGTPLLHFVPSFWVILLLNLHCRYEHLAKSAATIFDDSLSADAYLNVLYMPSTFPRSERSRQSRGHVDSQFRTASSYLEDGPRSNLDSVRYAECIHYLQDVRFVPINMYATFCLVNQILSCRVALELSFHFLESPVPPCIWTPESCIRSFSPFSSGVTDCLQNLGNLSHNLVAYLTFGPVYFFRLQF